MKKSMLICILLVFTLLVSVAHAEVMDETITPDLLREVYDTRHTAYGSAYALVTLGQDQPDGTYVETTIEPKLVSITYSYYTTRASNGDYIGGYVSHGSYPIVEATPSHQNVKVSVERIQYPTNNAVVGQVDTYNVLISGGIFRMTYTSYIHYSSQGSVISTRTTTVDRAFYYEKNGLK